MPIPVTLAPYRYSRRCEQAPLTPNQAPPGLDQRRGDVGPCDSFMIATPAPVPDCLPHRPGPGRRRQYECH